MVGGRTDRWYIGADKLAIAVRKNPILSLCSIPDTWYAYISLPCEALRIALATLESSSGEGREA